MCCSSNVKWYCWTTTPLWSVWGAVQTEEIIDISPATRVWRGATVSLSTLCLQSQAQDRPLDSRVLSSWLHSGLVLAQGQSPKWGSPATWVGATVHLSSSCLKSQGQDLPLNWSALLSWLQSGVVFTHGTNQF